MPFSQRTEQPLISAGYGRVWQFRPGIHQQCAGTFGREIKGTPSDKEFCSAFLLAAEAKTAIVVRNLLKPYLLVPVDLAHPDDKLCADLGLGAQDGLDANFFVRDVEKATGIKIPDKDAEKMLTLRDIVSFVQAEKSQRAGSGP